MALKRKPFLRNALVLSGGGARGAYQAGVVQGIAQICKKMGRSSSPFRILSGVSAGAINVAYLAAHIQDFQRAADAMCNYWSAVTSSQVFRTDFTSLGGIGLRVITDLTLGSLHKRKKIESLLDTSPLRHLLNKQINFSQVTKNIEAGILESVAVSTTDYHSSFNINFVQTNQKDVLWQRNRRVGEATILTVDHIMASSAIPIFFPPVQIGHRFFGDGCLRNVAPLSPAIHLGGDRLIIVGVRHAPRLEQPEPKHISKPTIATVIGQIINAMFYDATEMDVERLSRINHTISVMSEETATNVPLRPVEFIWIQPSQDISEVAMRKEKLLPQFVRYLIGGLGPVEETASIISYLLFHPEFCKELIDMGIRDTLARADDLEPILREK